MNEAATTDVEASRGLRCFSSLLLRLQPPVDDASLPFGVAVAPVHVEIGVDAKPFRTSAP
jgi:hypothetical protein